MKNLCSSSSKQQIVRESLKSLRNAKELKKNHVYDKTHNILVVGEDNFHFSKKLKEVVGSADSIYATCAHQSSASDEVKRAGAHDNKAALKHVFYGINPMKIASNEAVRGKGMDRIYDRVVCYEPKDQDAFGKFLGHCRKFISEEGQVHIFSSSKGPQLDWELENIAAKHGYRLNQGMTIPWDGAKKDHHYTVLPFSRDPEFKEEKEYTYPGKDFDWEAYALKEQEQAEADADADADADGGSGGGGGGEEEEDDDDDVV